MKTKMKYIYGSLSAIIAGLFLLSVLDNLRSSPTAESPSKTSCKNKPLNMAQIICQAPQRNFEIPFETWKKALRSSFEKVTWFMALCVLAHSFFVDIVLGIVNAF